MVGRSSHSASRKRAWTLIVLLAGAAGWSPASRAADNEVSLEHRVKAAFLYKIAGYVEWPEKVFPAKDTPLAIGVAGAEPLAEELARIAKDRRANDRAIRVKRVKFQEALDGLHVIFVGREHRNRVKELVPGALQRSGLVVTEWESALTQGSMVNFIIVDGRVRFEVALETAHKAGLKLSSRLLAVAHHVYSGAP